MFFFFFFIAFTTASVFCNHQGFNPNTMTTNFYTCGNEIRLTVNGPIIYADAFEDENVDEQLA